MRNGSYCQRCLTITLLMKLRYDDYFFENEARAIKLVNTIFELVVFHCVRKVLLKKSLKKNIYIIYK